MKLNKKQIIALKRVVDYVITSESDKDEEYTKAYPKLIMDDHVYTQANILKDAILDNEELLLDEQLHEEMCRHDPWMNENNK